MVQIKINQDKIIHGDATEEGIFINGKEMVWDIESIGPGCFHILKNNVSFRAEVLSFDDVSKVYEIRINHSIVAIQLKDQQDLLIEKLGWNSSSSGSIMEIKAPMPGLILSIDVSEGQEVNQGDPLIILEAMKMENIIKAPAQAKIKSIHAVKGQSVEKNQILIRF